jgi:hypothetical protein
MTGGSVGLQHSVVLYNKLYNKTNKKHSLGFYSDNILYMLSA